MISFSRHTRFAAFSIAALVSAATIVASASIAQAGELLDGDAIKTLVSGKRIFLATPLGGELPMNYRASGEVDAAGEAVGLGKFFKPSDKGRWWISGQKLCQKWQTWYDGKTICFTLESAGQNKLRWVQDNGDTGTARIGG